MGGVRHAPSGYSMTLEPEGSLGYCVYMACPCYDFGHMGVGVLLLGPLFYMVLYITKTTPLGVVCYSNVTIRLQNYEPLTHFWFLGCAVLDADHFTLSAQ